MHDSVHFKLNSFFFVSTWGKNHYKVSLKVCACISHKMQYDGTFVSSKIELKLYKVPGLWSFSACRYWFHSFFFNRKCRAFSSVDLSVLKWDISRLFGVISIISTASHLHKSKWIEFQFRPRTTLRIRVCFHDCGKKNYLVNKTLFMISHSTNV